MNNLFVAALDCLLCADPPRKARLSADTARRALAGELDFDPSNCAAPRALPEPGRPDRPHLVHPRQLAQRKLTTPLGRAALIHAVAHIEFNAINLAWDAVYRFR